MNKPPIRGLGIIVYGVQGIGKTSFALQFPGPLRLISVRDSGFQDLQEVGMVPSNCTYVKVDTFSELLQEIKDSDDEETVVIDGLSGVAQFMRDSILTECYEGPAADRLKAFGSFSEGWRIHGPVWTSKLETQCEYLRSKGVNIILIGHQTTETSKNTKGHDTLASVLDMEKWPRAVLTKWAQAVLFLDMDYQTQATKKWKGTVTEAKITDSVDDSVDRIMYTTIHPGHSAKNRLNLPNYIPMGESAEEAYENFTKKLPKPIQEKLKVSN